MERYDAVPSKLAYLGVPLALAGAYILFSVYSYFQPVPAGQEGPNPAIHFLLLTPFMAIVTFLATSLIAILLGALAYAAGMRQWAFTHWAVFMVRRFWARLFDHRVWIVGIGRSEEHTSELQSLMRISYAVFCLKKKIQILESQLV